MSQSMAWLMLVIAGLLDVGWAISMKYAEGYTRPGWSIISLALLAAFVFLLGRALQVLEIGVAYTVWTGIGAVGTLTMGVLLFGEALSPMKIGGWVERSDTHHSGSDSDGFRFALPILRVTTRSVSPHVGESHVEIAGHR